MTPTPSISAAVNPDDPFKSFEVTVEEARALLDVHDSGNQLVLQTVISNEDELRHELARQKMRDTVKDLRRQQDALRAALENIAQRAPQERELKAWLKLLGKQVQEIGGLLGAIRCELQSGDWVEIPRGENAEQPVLVRNPPLPPWPDYTAIAGSGRSRKELREQFSDKSNEQLWQARAYERATRDRSTVLGVIDRELDRRGATHRQPPPAR